MSQSFHNTSCLESRAVYSDLSEKKPHNQSLASCPELNGNDTGRIQIQIKMNSIPEVMVALL